MSDKQLTTQQPAAVVAANPILALLKKYEKSIAAIVPKHLTAEKMLKLVVNAMNREPKLLRCNPMTLINAVLTAAQLGLEIGPGSAYLLPFKTKRKNSPTPYDCTLVIDYRGKISLALRSGKVLDVDPEIVYSKEKFKIWRGEDGIKRIEHEPMFFKVNADGEHLPIEDGDRGVPIGAYVVTSLRDGPPKITFMGRADIMKIKAKSPASSGPWISPAGTTTSDELEMWKKSVVHRAFKTMPSSADDFDAMRRAQDIEDRVDIGATLDNVIDYLPEDEDAPGIVQGDDPREDLEEQMRQQSETVRKEEELKQGVTQDLKQDESSEEISTSRWPDRANMLKAFATLRQMLGDIMYFNILGTEGVGSTDEDLGMLDPATSKAYDELLAASQQNATKSTGNGKKQTSVPTVEEPQLGPQEKQVSEEIYPVRITLRNIKAIAKATLRFKAEPGKGELITIGGDNGVGKTCILDGIAAIVEGGWNPDLIRFGEEDADAEMLLSNGTIVHRHIDRQGYELKVISEDGVPMEAPQTYVNKLASGFGFDTIDFDQAPDDKKMKWLMKVMPMNFTRAEVVESIGEARNMLDETLAAGYTIETLGKLEQILTKRRAAAGNSRDEHAGAAERSRKTLMNADQGEEAKDWRKELVTLQTRKTTATNAMIDKISAWDKDLAVERKRLQPLIQAVDDAADADFQALLKLAREGDQSISSIDELALHPRTLAMCKNLSELASRKAELTEMEANTDRSKQTLRNTNASALQELAGQIATATTENEAQLKMSGIREQMEISQGEADRYQGQWNAFDMAIKNVERLRRSKLETLPVPNLVIDAAGKFFIRVDDQLTPWAHVNQSKRWIKSMEVGAQGIGKTGLMIADEAEHLGPTNWKQFEKAVIAFGVTVVAARVFSAEEIKKFGPELQSQPKGALTLDA